MLVMSLLEAEKHTENVSRVKEKVVGAGRFEVGLRPWLVRDWRSSAGCDDIVATEIGIYGSSSVDGELVIRDMAKGDPKFLARFLFCIQQVQVNKFLQKS
jgi:hypothetical protein